MEEIRVEKKTKGRTAYNYTKKKIVVIDDNFELQCSGKDFFVDRTFIRAYDCSGNYLQDVHRDGPEYVVDVTWILEHTSRVLVQIGYEFMLVPANGASNVAEISDLIHLLDDSEIFPYNFKGSGIGGFRTHDRVDSTLFNIASTKRAISKNEMEILQNLKYEFNKGCEEICYCGNHLSINSNAQDNFNIDKYTANYNKAIIDHPKWRREIERLYLLNVGIQKWKSANKQLEVMIL